MPFSQHHTPCRMVVRYAGGSRSRWVSILGGCLRLLALLLGLPPGAQGEPETSPDGAAAAVSAGGPDRCYRMLGKPRMQFTGTSGSNAWFTLTFTVQNSGPAAVRYLYLVAAQSCLVFQPPVIDLTQPAFGGTTLPTNGFRTLTVPFKVGVGCPLPHRVTLGLFDSGFRECCARAFELPFSGAVRLSGFESGTVFPRPAELSLRAQVDASLGARSLRILADGREVARGTKSTVVAPYRFPAEAAVAFVAEATLADDTTVTSDLLFALVPPRKPVPAPPSLGYDLTPSGLIVLRFATVNGRVHRIESTDSLGPAAWRPERSVVGDGLEASFVVDATLARARFFRVVIP